MASFFGQFPSWIWAVAVQISVSHIVPYNRIPSISNHRFILDNKVGNHPAIQGKADPDTIYRRQLREIAMFGHRTQ
jgi:hypothetical protein